jgi:hypothetical protein
MPELDVQRRANPVAAARRSEAFRNETELAAALKRVWPDPPRMSMARARLRRAQRSILVEAGRLLHVAFGFSEGSVDLCRGTVSSHGAGPQFGREHVSVAVEDPTEPGQFDEITIRGILDCRPNAVATLFASILHQALAAALAMVEGHRGRGAFTEQNARAFEMIVLSMEEWTTLAFLRLFIEEPMTQSDSSRARAYPADDTFVPAKALEQWIRRIPGSTFEGNHLQTGIVLEATTTQTRTACASEVAAFFASPIPLAEALASTQDMVMADGRRSFLLVRKDMMVHGVLVLGSPVDLEYLQSVQAAPVDATMVDRLWIQVVDHRRLAIHGTMRDDSLIHVADVEQGGLRLRDPRAELDIAVKAIASVVGGPMHPAIRPLVLSLLTRTVVGLGGGLVIGERPAQISVRRAVERGFGPAVATPAWLSLLNRDGIALLDEGLELTGVGCFIENIAGNTTRGLGTRHAALAKATEGRRNVGIAMSDDGTLTLYRSGNEVVRLG